MGAHADYGKRVLQQAAGDSFECGGESVKIDYRTGHPARIDGSVDGSKPIRRIYSQRMRIKRQMKYRQWLAVRMDSDRWGELGDRVEILWRPDPRGYYDLCFFQEKEVRYCFSDNLDQFTLPVDDKREEIKNFDLKEEFRSIGIHL